MSKKQMEALDAAPTPTMLDDAKSAIYNIRELTVAYELRETAINFAISHHKINGGMLTVDQILANADRFHAYITGETK